MPFKPKGRETPEDYPERYQTRPPDCSWIEDHQADNVKRLIGDGGFAYLERLDKKRKGVKNGCTFNTV